MREQIKFKGVDRQKFIPWNTEPEKNYENIQKISLKFYDNYLKLECPECKCNMDLIPAEIRKSIMEIGVVCPNCKNQKFLIKIQFDRHFNSSIKL